MRRLKNDSDLVENDRATLEDEVQALRVELQARAADLERIRAAMDDGAMGSSCVTRAPLL